MGALTSKPYAFQYRAWELRSHVSFDTFDFFNPPVKIQFLNNSITRVLPLSLSSLPWLSDLFRFNFPYAFSSLSPFVSFSVTFSKHISYKFFGAACLIFNEILSYFYFNKFENVFLSYSSYIKSALRSLSPQTINFVFLYNFNLREFSPSIIAVFRFTSNLKFIFFNTFFDFKGVAERSFFFPSSYFFKSFVSFKAYPVLKFLATPNSLIFSKFSFNSLPTISFQSKLNLKSQFQVCEMSANGVISNSKVNLSYLHSNFFFFNFPKIFDFVHSSFCAVTDLPSPKLDFPFKVFPFYFRIFLDTISFSRLSKHPYNFAVSSEFQLFRTQRRLLNTPYSALFDYRQPNLFLLLNLMIIIGLFIFNDGPLMRKIKKYYELDIRLFQEEVNRYSRIEFAIFIAFCLFIIVSMSYLFGFITAFLFTQTRIGRKIWETVSWFLAPEIIEHLTWILPTFGAFALLFKFICIFLLSAIISFLIVFFFFQLKVDFSFELVFPIIISITQSLVLFLPFILAVAYLTLIERKVLGSVQLRRGPDVVGPFGLLQAFADALKLLFKELVTPYVANKPVFFVAPMLTFFFAFFGLIMLPFYSFEVIFDTPLSLILFFGLSTLGIYGIILSGWASNSRYAFLGSLRSTAQLISYEVSLGLVIQTVALPPASLSFVDIVAYQQHYGIFFFPFFITFILFLISSFAETNRPPFDLPEAEAELVSGYNVEYSSSTFALFFIGEYANLITTTLVTVFFFFGGASETSVLGPFALSLKIFFFLIFFLLIRAALPRFRYDQLMQLSWKGILPISFAWFCFTVVIFYFFSN